MNSQSQITKDFIEFTRTRYPELYREFSSGTYPQSPKITSPSNLGRKDGGVGPGDRTPGASGHSLRSEILFDQAWEQFVKRGGAGAGINRSLQTLAPLGSSTEPNFMMKSSVEQALNIRTRKGINLLPETGRYSDLTSWLMKEKASGGLPDRMLHPEAMKSYVRRHYPGTYDAHTLERAVSTIYGGNQHIESAPGFTRTQEGQQAPGYIGNSKFNRKTGEFENKLARGFKSTGFDRIDHLSIPINLIKSNSDMRGYLRMVNQDRRLKGLPDLNPNQRGQIIDYVRMNLARKEVDLRPLKEFDTSMIPGRERKAFLDQKREENPNLRVRGTRRSGFLDPGGVALPGRGKYAGTQLRDLPDEYLQKYLMNAKTRDPALRRAIGEVLRTRGKQFISENGGSQRYLGSSDDVWDDRGNMSGPDLRKYKDDKGRFVDQRDPQARFLGASFDREDRGFGGTSDNIGSSFTPHQFVSTWTEDYGSYASPNPQEYEGFRPSRASEGEKRGGTLWTKDKWGRVQIIGGSTELRPEHYKSRRQSLRYPKVYDPDYYASRNAADINRMIFGRGNAVNFDPITGKYKPTINPMTGNPETPVSSAFKGEFRSAARKVFGKSLMDQILDPNLQKQTVPTWRKTSDGKWEPGERQKDPYENLKKLLYQARMQLYLRSGEFESNVRWGEEFLQSEKLENEVRDPYRQPFNPMVAAQETLRQRGYSPDEIQQSLSGGVPIRDLKKMSNLEIMRMGKREHEPVAIGSEKASTTGEFPSAISIGGGNSVQFSQDDMKMISENWSQGKGPREDLKFDPSVVKALHDDERNFSVREGRDILHSTTSASPKNSRTGKFRLSDVSSIDSIEEWTQMNLDFEDRYGQSLSPLAQTFRDAFLDKLILLKAQQNGGK